MPATKRWTRKKIERTSYGHYPEVRCLDVNRECIGTMWPGLHGVNVEIWVAGKHRAERKGQTVSWQRILDVLNNPESTPIRFV